MGLVALVCPQCGASLNLDDSFEFGFCQYCGTKIMLHDVIEVRHSGTIKIDYSEQEKNYLELATNSFNAANIREAYTYYLKTLEVNPDDIIAVYMKGICAIMLSDPAQMRIPEYTHGARRAKELMKNLFEEDKASLLGNLETVSTQLLDSWLAHGKPAQAVKSSKDANDEFVKCENIISLGIAVCKELESESLKQEFLKRTYKYLHEVRGASIKYMNGYQRDINGRSVPAYGWMKPSFEHERCLDEQERELAHQYISLSFFAANLNLEKLPEKPKQALRVIKSMIKDAEREAKYTGDLGAKARAIALEEQRRNMVLQK